MSSILNDVKHSLGLTESDTAFDGDIMMHVNTAIATLVQLGVGPPNGFSVKSAEDSWDEITTDAKLEGVRTFVYLKTKLAFDPPTVGFVISSYDRQLDELAWRLMVTADVG